MADAHEPIAPAAQPVGMNARAGRRPAESPTCPLLGLLDDPTSRFSYPIAGHRCGAGKRRQPIDLGHQGAFCLAATYPECPRYRQAATSRRPGAAMPPTPEVVLETVKTATGGPGDSNAPGDSAAGGEAGRQPPGRSRWGRRVGVIILAGCVLAGAAWLAGPSITDWMRHAGADSGVASPSLSTAPPASPVPAGTATPAPTSTATPTPTPSPATPSPAVSSTPTPTYSPSPTPTRAAAPVVHVVARGETLIGIAALYGVPVAAIAKANNITDPGLIRVGQRLVIPRR